MGDETILTDRELDAMNILWREGSGTVSEVREHLGEPLAYTTVLWMLQTLESKGYVRHEKEGRAYRYHPLIEQEAAGGSALNRMVDRVFQGSAAMLLAQLVAERQLPADELERMRDLLDRRLAEEGDQ
jgi:predicted transcriptional regulator